MGSLFSSPSPPRPTPQVAPPREEDKAVQEAAADAARRRRLGRGFRSTILRDMVQSGEPRNTLGA